MQRAALKSPGGSLEIETLDGIPEPPDRGVLVKVKFCGICHSDVMWVENAVDVKQNPSSDFAVIFPFVPGHEVSGEVYKLGKDVEGQGLQVGDNVLIFPWIGCCECEDCRLNNTENCSRDANEVGFQVSGGYGNYVVVMESQYALKVPDSIPVDIACTLPCSGLTTFSAVSKIKPYFESDKESKQLLLIGAGGLGLWCLQIARACLPPNTRIVCADIAKEKLDFTLQNGADDVILWDDSKSSDTHDDEFIKAMKIKSNGGFHGIIDLVNSSQTAPRAIMGLRKGGALVMVGLFGGELKVNLRSLVRQKINLFGMKVGSHSNLIELLDIVTTSMIKFPPMTYFSLDEVNDALEKVCKGKIIGRGVLRYK